MVLSNGVAMTYMASRASFFNLIFKISIKIYRENKHRPIGATFFFFFCFFFFFFFVFVFFFFLFFFFFFFFFFCFLTHHDSLNKLGSLETVLINYIQISPVVSDKKSFKICYIDILEK